METKYITLEEWEEKYKPIRNSITFREEFNNWMFETFDHDDAHIRNFSKTNPKQVWTVLTGGECGDVIVQGFHLVDRYCHFITEVPFDEKENVEVLLEGSQDFGLEEKHKEDFITFSLSDDIELDEDMDREDYESEVKDLVDKYRDAKAKDKGFIQFEELFVYVNQNTLDLDSNFNEYLNNKK